MEKLKLGVIENLSMIFHFIAMMTRYCNTYMPNVHPLNEIIIFFIIFLNLILENKYLIVINIVAQLMRLKVLKKS